MRTQPHAALIVAAAALALWAWAPAAGASEKIAKETGLQCTQCHDKPGSKLLTDRGKYFEMFHTMEGYDSIQASFGKCTSCHEKKPGSTKLTKQGKQMSELVKNMDGLREWLKTNHPKPATK